MCDSVPENGSDMTGIGTERCQSPDSSVCSTSTYVEAKQSFTNTEELAGHRQSTGSDISDDVSLTAVLRKPHKGNDVRWDAIRAVRLRYGAVGLDHFRLLRKLGSGDIGSVYLSELKGTRSCFAMKVMDKENLEARKKSGRAETEREILQCLDHPFLPTLYAHFETDKFYCLVMELCPGGDLHGFRQRQPGRCFVEHAARFYAAEVLLALEYLHMLGIIYRDLKPENVLVREDGHIMLSDFDLSLQCAVSPTLVKSSTSTDSSTNCAINKTCFGPRGFFSKPKNSRLNNRTVRPELVAEPTGARSMSFVGTHEYLAPEIVRGEGHGSAVDWWTFGIFLYELLFGKTPFRGATNRATLFNVVGQSLRFPDLPSASLAAKDLIGALLVKDPARRLGYARGATEVKQHAFFESVNWALIRCASPPQVPERGPELGPVKDRTGVDVMDSGDYLDMEFF